MSESSSKQSSFLLLPFVIAVALVAVLLRAPAYVHYGKSRIPGSYNALYISNYSP